MDNLEYCIKKIKQIQDETREIAKDREQALKFYRADPDIVQIIQDRSKLTTTDMSDIVEWLKPAILDVLASNEDVTILSPQSEEDVKPAEYLNRLVNYQLKVKNNWFLIMHDWIDDMLKLKTGILKFQWVKEKKKIIKEYGDETLPVSEQELNAILSAPNITNVSILKEIPVNTNGIQSVGYIAEVTYEVEDEYPLIEVVPPHKVGFPIDTKDIKKAKFIYHYEDYEEWEFVKEFGKSALKKVKQTVEAIDSNESRELYSDLSKDFIKSSENTYRVWECQYPNPKTGEPWITTICGDQILRDERNKYGYPTYVVITPIKMAHRVYGLSIYDIIKELQQIRTRLLRQMEDNIAFANNQRYLGDPARFVVEDFLKNNKPNALIRTFGDPREALVPEVKGQLPPWSITFLEMLEKEKDRHMPLGRAFTGINPSALNKTFRGQSQQIAQSAMRVKMLIRLIAEMGIAPLVQNVIDMNMKFLTKSTAIKTVNGFINLTPDMITCQTTVLVDVGVGSSKDQQIANMQQLLAIYAQIAKANVPIITAQNIYNAVKKLLKAMGVEDYQEMITEPKTIEVMKGLLQEVIKHITVMTQNGIPVSPELLNSAQTAMSVLGVNFAAIPEVAGGLSPNQPAQPYQPYQPFTSNVGGVIEEERV